MQTTTAAQRGFTLVEVMVAASVFAVVALVLVGLIYEYNRGSKRLDASQHARADIAHLLDQWESDQSSADAIFIPDYDVFGAGNTALAHEVDFYAKDASNRPYYWAYYYDAAAQTLQRYDYSAPGAPASKDGFPFTAITRFSPSLHAISEIANPSSPIYMPIFKSAIDYDVPLGAGNKVVGGTHVVHVDLATAQERLPVELTAAGAPSGFTVVLNYTPAPTPTPAATPTPAFTVEPAGVQYAPSGGSLAYLSAPRDFDFGGLINVALGGGVAQAAGCSARAYATTNFADPSKIVTPATFPQLALDLQITDPSGCYDGHVVAKEGVGAFGGTFGYIAGSCASLLTPIGWTPANPITSPANLTISSDTASGSCVFTVKDNSTRGSPNSASVAAEVMGCAGPYMIQPGTGAEYCSYHYLFSAGFRGTTQGGSNSDGWFAQPATSPIPMLDCSVPPDGQGGGGCQSYTYGATEYCYNMAQGQPLLTVTPAQGNTTGFTCGNTRNPHEYKYIPCVNPPGNPRYCAGPAPAPSPGPGTGGGG